MYYNVLVVCDTVVFLCPVVLHYGRGIDLKRQVSCVYLVRYELVVRDMVLKSDNMVLFCAMDCNLYYAPM